MTRAAVNFEYEHMTDGSLRVRFLDRENAILGQQFIAPEGLVPLQLLIALAHSRSSGLESKTLQAVFRVIGLDADRSFVQSLRDAIRVRVGVTPDGDLDLRAIEGE